VAMTVVTLRLAAVGEWQLRTVGEEERVRRLRAWGPLLPDGPVSRSFGRTDLQGLAHVRSCHST
jgi:hypothetical protein